MNEVILSQNSAEQTMDSDEISELVEARPDNVKRTIERLALKGVITLPPMEEKPTAGRTAKVYVFAGEKGKRDSIIVVAQLSPEFTARLVDRWQELERMIAQKPKELSRMELIQLAFEAEQENQLLRSQVSILEPKAQALDTIAETENTYTIRDCAKTIGIKEKDLINLLIGKKWIYREESTQKLQPYAEKVSVGVFINRVSPVIKNQDGQDRVFLHMRITAFGLTRITGLVNKMRGNAA